MKKRQQSRNIRINTQAKILLLLLLLIEVKGQNLLELKKYRSFQ